MQPGLVDMLGGGAINLLSFKHRIKNKQHDIGLVQNTKRATHMRGKTTDKIELPPCFSPVTNKNVLFVFRSLSDSQILVSEQAKTM